MSTRRATRRPRATSRLGSARGAEGRARCARGKAARAAPARPSTTSRRGGLTRPRSASPSSPSASAPRRPATTASSAPIYDYEQGLKFVLTTEGKRSEHTFPARDQFAPELIEFSRCVLAHREPEASGEEGLADIRVVEAILQSARSGQAVQLPPWDRARRPDLAQEHEKPPVAAPEPIRAPSPTIR